MVYISTVCCTCSFYMMRKMIRRRLAYGMEWFRSVIILENGGGEPDMEDMDCTVEQAFGKSAWEAVK